ncbi:MAG: hypothetical protein PHC61_14060 [Chitinivibrionales bacterium]|nr:hypothetical protein [Chitinivibrionales bacterium]
MRSVLCVLSLSVVLIAMSVSAQNKPMVPKSNSSDTLQQKAACCDKGPGMLNFRDHAMNPPGDARGFAMRRNWMEQNYGERFGEQGREHHPMWGMPMMQHGHGHFFIRKIVKMMALACFIMNILLTILVSLDMAKLGRFNGLWIPITLLMGIPGSIIYALFRIGDNLRGANIKA